MLARFAKILRALRLKKDGFAQEVLKFDILHQKHQKGRSPRVSKGAELLNLTRPC
jgi:hypothetical protein